MYNIRARMTTAQKHIGSAFNASSTAADVMTGIDLAGKTAIVTGGYSGLGLVAAATLAEAGAQVVVPARDVEKARHSLNGVPGIEVLPLDLIDPSSIEAFAAGFLANERPLSLLINSAGVMASPLCRDGAGHESQFAINHLGHFRLVRLLLPALATNGGRVVAVSSRGHQIAGVDFDDINFEHRPYDKWVAYGQSKTANVLFAQALDRRAKALGVRAFSLHPGQILTNLARHLSDKEVAGFDALDSEGNPKIDPEKGMKTPEQGAATILWCATSPQLAGKGGVYCEDCDIAEVNTAEVGRAGVAPWAIDEAAAERLWDLSCDLTGLSREFS